MDGKSLSITEERIKELKKIFPEVFSENRIDFDRLRNILGDNVKDKDERYNLSWAGKSEAYRILQQPSFATLIPEKEESVDFDNTNNIFIEGENLEVLKILQRSYFNKIKMIYIDPPYNTGKDSFVYPDKFSETKKDYQQRIGVKDEEGKLLKEGEFNLNSKENGQYHSNWLNMMMPRLFLAKNLLKEDGVIFVSIDDNEVHNLKLLMNEIFGEENFIGLISRRQSSGSKNDTANTRIISSIDYVLCYSRSDSFSFYPYRVKNAKNFNHQDEKGKFSLRCLEKQGGGDTLPERPKMGYSIYYNKSKNSVEILFDYSLNNNPIYEEPNKELLEQGYECFRPRMRDMEMGIWRWGYETFLKKFNDNEVFFNNGQVYSKDRETEYLEKYPEAYIDDYINTQGTNEVKELFNSRLFDFPKPTGLLKYFFQVCTSGEDIILDFFAGSGTTGHALMKLNSEDEGKRKFILVQLPEICKDDSVAKKNGYDTIAEICKERLRRAGKKIKEDITAQNVDTGFKVFKLQESNFKQWKEVDNEKDLSEQLEMFVDDIKDKNINEINILYEIIIKHGYNLNSTIEKKENLYFVADKNDNKQMLVCLKGEINKELISQITQSGVKNIVVLDRLFKGNDCLKTNMYLEMKDNDINFECI